MPRIITVGTRNTPHGKVRSYYYTAADGSNRVAWGKHAIRRLQAAGYRDDDIEKAKGQYPAIR